MMSPKGECGLCARAISLALALAFMLAPAAATGDAARPDPGQVWARSDQVELIEGLVADVDSGMLRERIQTLQDFGTRYALRGDKCYPASDYIASVFEANGLDVEFDYFPYEGCTMRNVIGTKEGAASPGETLIVCAHYDSYSTRAMYSAPGADDDASGTAAVMTIAEILSDYDLNCTVKFIAFGCEEEWMIGSYHYLEDVLAAGTNITAVINLDMIGHNPDPALPYVYLYTGETGSADPSALIAEVMDTAALHPSIGLQVIDGGYAPSDHLPFSVYFPAIMLEEYNFSPYYHRTTETIDKLNMTYCANITQIALATLARMAGIMPGDVSPPALGRGLPRSFAPGMPAISIQAADPSGLDPATLEMRVNGAPVSPVTEAVPLGWNVSYSPPAPFADGTDVNVTFAVSDLAGNRAAQSWAFIVDAVPPEPPADFTISQSRVEMVKRGLCLDIGTTYDAAQVVAPSVLRIGGEYRMWYAATSSAAFSICYANSSDGLDPGSWARQGVVVPRGALGEPDGYGAAHPTVVYDGEYRMWYAGFDNTRWRIMYANSTDGVNWVKRGIALDDGAPGQMDSASATYPNVLVTDEYEMWYLAFDGVEYRYTYANSTDGLVWTKRQLDVTPKGAGSRCWGELKTDLAVGFDGTMYHMYYGMEDGLNTRTLLALSQDGLNWNTVGLTLDASPGDEPDYQGADHCSVLFDGGETRLYYSGLNGNWRIMMANLTSADRATDLSLTWTPSASADVVGYELFRETRLERLCRPLERARRPAYLPPEGLTPWAFEAVSAANATVQGPTTGSDPTFFYLPEGGLLDLTLCLEYGTGEWSELISENDYYADMGLGFVQLFTGELPAGTTVRAWYNASKSKALWAGDTADCLADVRAGAASWMSYYYVIRAVDRAGNLGQSPVIVGKIGTDMVTSWNLVCSPFLDSPKPVAEALEGMDWSVARTWDPALFPNQWTIAHPEPMPLPDTLTQIDVDDGVWAKVDTADIFAVCGPVSDVTIELRAGWNLVAYPYHDIKTVADALAGVPWDRVEVFCPSEPGFMLEAVPSDQLYPGSGLWVHATSDFPWYADNAP